MVTAGTTPQRPVRLDRRLDALVDALRALDLTAGDPAAIEALLPTAPLADAELEPFVWFTPGRYTRNAVYRDDFVEVIVLCWDAASGSPVHDHGQSRCYVAVQRGELIVENFALVEAGRAPGPARLAAGPTEIMTAGTIDTRTPDRDIHRMTPSGGAAVSLHVYSPPLTASLVYDLEGQTCHLAHMRYDRPPR
jgi:cysteine dioxygenase